MTIKENLSLTALCIRKEVLILLKSRFFYLLSVLSLLLILIAFLLGSFFWTGEGRLFFLLNLLPLLLVFLSPLLAVKTIQLEATQNTLPLLASLPIDPWQIYIAKIITLQVIHSLFIFLALLLLKAFDGTGELNGALFISQFFILGLYNLFLVSMSLLITRMVPKTIAAYFLSVLSLLVVIHLPVPFVNFLYPMGSNSIPPRIIDRFISSNLDLLDFNDLFFFSGISFIVFWLLCLLERKKRQDGRLN